MYTVDEYLQALTDADRQPRTIELYRGVFRSYAKFLDVPLEDVHNHLLPENLIKYAASQKGMSGRGIRARLTVLRAYFLECGVEFRPMQMKVLLAKRREDPNDKPLTLDLLQRMMDMADTHGKAVIAFLISTGIRPGEAAKITLSDVVGNTVAVRDAIAKGRRGGVSFLTTEAREFIDIWLKSRDDYIRLAAIRSRCLGKIKKPDDLLFACSYNTISVMFTNLYRKCDGEKGKYGNRITPHSCRKYFRTQAAKGGMHLDVVYKILRQEGYLTSHYVRLTTEELRREFHEHEDALYITRRDRRHSESQIALVNAKNRELEDRIALMEKIIQNPVRK